MTWTIPISFSSLFRWKHSLKIHLITFKFWTVVSSSIHSLPFIQCIGMMEIELLQEIFMLLCLHWFEHELKQCIQKHQTSLGQLPRQCIFIFRVVYLYFWYGRFGLFLWHTVATKDTSILRLKCVKRHYHIWHEFLQFQYLNFLVEHIFCWKLWVTFSL